MTSTKTVMVDRDELEMAFEFVSSGAPYENTASISVATGKIHWHSAMGDMEDDDDPDDDEDAEDDIAVPHKNDLDLGRSLVLRFVGQEMPRDYDTVTRFLSAARSLWPLQEPAGAAPQVGTVVRVRSNVRRTRHCSAWCEENGIQLVDARPDSKRA